MLITKTAPVPFIPDSFVVTIEMMIGDADAYTHLEMGPFKRLEHWDNLENLLQTLVSVEQEECGEQYSSVPGFEQWFNARRSDAPNYSDYAWNFEPEDDEEEIAQEKAFELGKEFAQSWPVEPNMDDYRQAYVGHEVFYYDNNGIKCNTTVALDAS